ncbi:efflux RND transporter periplasmic adaptor subunit [Paenibacillus sp. P96]|uniref:Efflux RND transporter periplasmic adaptor subunit n=1 Tax=Paenibacillus zeirhizosphaerae TaxID=2987519 RepID=A0ABT9FPA3_9BACL|nr:efflux RND transporter periplasmic adaptor subunit [Paenibacillus sp. P96]MDP4096550.1 efflux RND transporter periplasmic adaptor subunit [Paenibacillus sp. P96]
MKITKLETTLAAVLLGTAMLSGCSGSGNAAQDMVVPVKVSQAQEGIIGEGEIYTGVVTPSETVNIVSKLAGKVVELPVDVGSEVRKGQVLFKLEDNDLRNNLAKAKAAASASAAAVSTAEASHESSLVSAASGVVSSKNGVISSQSAINQAQGGLNQAKTAVKQAKNGLSSAANTVKQTAQALADAQKALTRTQALFNDSAVPQAQLEQAQTAVVSAQTAYDNAVNAKANAENQLDAAQKALDTAEQAYKVATSSYENASDGYSNAQRQLEVSHNTATIEANREAFKQAQLNVSIAQDALDDSVITSPIDGIVGTKNTEIGEMVSASSPAMVIADLSTVNTLIYVPAEQINKVKTGDKVQVRVTASDLITTGTVKSVSPLDSSGKGYPVKISVANPDMQLKSGMLADISFVNNDAQQGMIVPSGALLEEDAKSYVFVVNGDHVARKEVTVASESGSQALITSGLEKGETIAVNNLALLSDNSAIKITQ